MIVECFRKKQFIVAGFLRPAWYNANMLKDLRIAVTALSLTACALLIALWVRSMYSRDLASLGDVTVASMPGRIILYTLPNGGGPWRLEDHPKYAAVLEAVAGVPIAFGNVSAGSYVTAPYWFLVVVSAAIGALLQWRHPYRFTVRTLLIATTLVALGLGIIAVSS
jgi:hypothetical protein